MTSFLTRKREGGKRVGDANPHTEGGGIAEAHKSGLGITTGGGEATLKVYTGASSVGVSLQSQHSGGWARSGAQLSTT